MKRFLYSILAAVLITGCIAVKPAATFDELAVADVGTAPDDYEKQIKEFWAPRLIDPTAPLYTFQPAKRGYSDRFGNNRAFGWNVDFQLNSKNRMGGYTGNKSYTSFFKDGRLLIVYEIVYGSYYPIN